MVPNSFLIILFSIIIILPFIIAQLTLDDYYNEVNQDTNNVNGEDLEDNDCLCDINPLECDFQCCCDENCPNEAIENWENHSKCINEQNTPRLSDDKCVDINLFPTWYYNSSKEYPRRGIHLEKQTEDVPKKSAVITNLCFSIDNSKSKDIKTLDDLEKYGYKSIDKLYDDIFDLYIEPYFINNNKENSNSETGTANTLRRTDEANTENGIGKGITINNNDKFVKVVKNKQYFSLYSGTKCENINIVEKWSPNNYSCLMETGETIKFNYFNNLEINGIPCYSDDSYYIEDSGEDEGLLKEGTKNNNDFNVLQVEFILNINSQTSNINKCIINIVEYNNNKTFMFKNSVIFTNNNIIPYRYSGNIGYLNGYPLKIFFQGNVYNDFYIVGRKKDGSCRTGNDILNYLYFSDKPLLFNEDYTYSCTLANGTSVTTTTLYKKLDEIKKIAKYGSSDYNNINDQDDWIDVDNNFGKKIGNIVAQKDVFISMNIYIRTNKKKGFYSHKYIYKTSIDIENGDDCVNNKCNIKLEIKYNGDDETNESKYKKIPDIPFFIPNIPDDILDPLINPDVDK